MTTNLKSYEYLSETLDCCADTNWAHSMENHDHLSLTEYTEYKKQVIEKLKAQSSEATFVQNYKHINSMQWKNSDQ